MSETIIIRTATAADVSGLCRLAEELVSQHVAYDQGRFQPPPDVASAYADLFAAHIDKPQSVVVVAERGGELIG